MEGLVKKDSLWDGDVCLSGDILVQIEKSQQAIKCWHSYSSEEKAHWASIAAMPKPFLLVYNMYI